MTTEHRLRTLAHQLADALHVYADSFSQWCANPSDVAKYQRAHSNLELVQLLTGKTFPGGRGELGELVLYHADIKMLVLKRHIARRAGDELRPADEAQLHNLCGKHADVVLSLHAVCVRRGGAQGEYGLAVSPRGAPGTSVPAGSASAAGVAGTVPVS